MKTTNKNFRELAIRAGKGLKRVVTSLQFLLVTCLMLVSGMAFAQATGAAGFEKATQTISGYQIEVSKLMKAIAAVIAIVGAFNVYFKMQNGDQDVKKTIMLTIGGCIAFVALSEMLPLFFN